MNALKDFGLPDSERNEEIEEKDDWKSIKNEAVRSNLEDILVNISEELNENLADSVSREAAAYKLKCVLTSKDPKVRLKKREQWFSFSQSSRTCIKKNILKSMSLEMEKPNLVSECVSHISCAELPRGEWNELSIFFDENITNTDSSETIKQLTLETIICIYDEIDDKCRTDQLNDAVIKIIFHVLKYDKSFPLKITALHLFLKSINRLSVVFENEPEKQLMLEALCETTEADNPEMNIIGIKSLEMVVLSYYNHVRKELNTDILQIIIKAIKSKNSEIRLKGIKFLQSVCSEEEKLQITYATQNNALFFVESYLKQLLPLLMYAAAQQDEIGSIKETNIHQEALNRIKSCLSFIVLFKCELTLKFAIDFVKEHIENPRWSYRNAAILVFESVIRKCNRNDLCHLFEIVVPKLIHLLQDSSHRVKNSTIVALKCLCENFKEVIVSSEVDLGIITELLLKTLDDKLSAAISVCEAINAVMCIAHYKAMMDVVSLDNTDPQTDFGHEQLETYCLSNQFKSVVFKLVKLMLQSEVKESDLGRSVHDTLYCVIQDSPKDCSIILSKIMDPILDNLRAILKSERVDENADNCLMLILPILKCTLKKIPSVVVLTYADELISSIFHILDTYQSKISVDALKMLSVIVKSLGTDFSKYIVLFKPHMVKGLTIYNSSMKIDNIQIAHFNAAIYTTSVVCHSIGCQILPYCDEIISLLCSVFKCHFICYQHKLKPVFSLLSIIDDLADLVGTEFKTYFNDIHQLFKELWQQMHKSNTNKAILNKLCETYSKTCLTIATALSDNSITSHEELLNLAITAY